jgi:hypothetical protein
MDRGPPRPVQTPTFLPQAKKATATSKRLDLSR